MTDVKDCITCKHAVFKKVRTSALVEFPVVYGTCHKLNIAMLSNQFDCKHYSKKDR